MLNGMDISIPFFMDKIANNSLDIRSSNSSDDIQIKNDAFLQLMVHIFKSTHLF